MNRVLLSLMAIAAMLALVAGASLAYFNDIETSTGNVLQAGCSPDLELDDPDESYGRGYDNVSATWVSPSNWLPGDVLEGSWLSLHIKQTPDATPAKTVIMHWEVTDSGGDHPESELEADPSDDSKLSEQIIITKFKYCYVAEPDKCNLLPVMIDYYDSNDDGKLQLSEIHCLDIDLETLAAIRYHGTNWQAHREGFGLGVGFPKPWNEYCEVLMDFQFDPDAGNAYQGDQTTATVNITIYEDVLPWP